MLEKNIRIGGMIPHVKGIGEVCCEPSLRQGESASNVSRRPIHQVDIHENLLASIDLTTRVFEKEPTDYQVSKVAQVE